MSVRLSPDIVSKSIETELEELKVELAKVEKEKNQACSKLQETFIQVDKYSQKNTMFEI